ncbi:PREDICTED: zinc finger protein 75D-like [Sturnus vulgaris]|uniref:zinc finger protein 75D-like n=1 Tax=Sturnus vulgaris TaxID=9172 RepID=UPI00071AA5B2|nr:PREDICTED: zinc finger protein 75D-like [Sturnus vulgaris]
MEEKAAGKIVQDTQAGTELWMEIREDKSPPAEPRGRGCFECSKAHEVNREEKPQRSRRRRACEPSPWYYEEERHILFWEGSQALLWCLTSSFRMERCPTSSWNFSNSSDLLIHQWVHTGKPSFKCEECGMSFSQSSNLNCYQKIHTGEWPYRFLEMQKEL